MAQRMLMFLLGYFFLSACAAPEFRGSALEFGVSAKEASQVQQERLSSLSETQLLEIRRGLAEDRVILSYSSQCALLVTPDVDRKECIVVRRDGQTIDQPERFTSVLALNRALGLYGESLASLAADVSEDRAAFSKSLVDLASSAQSLLTTLDGSQTEPSETLISAAGSFGNLGATLFAAQRVRVLKDVIRKTDPQVQEAAQLLALVSEALSLAEFQTAFNTVEGTRSELQRKILAGADTGEVATLQAKLFAEVDQLRKVSSASETYLAIAKTHATLAEATERGMSAKELFATLLELNDSLEQLKAISNSL